MRIAQVCPYSLTVPGGVQTQVLGLARALRDLGHETRVLAPCDGPPPDPMVTPLGKSVPTAINGSMAPIAPDPACALRTIHALRNESFDILHLHEPVSPGPTFTALMVSDAPIIGTFHASGGARTAYSYLPWAARRVARKLKVRVAVSEEARLTAERNVGGHYEVLYNGIEIDRFANAEPAPKTNRTILFVGRHEPRKGLTVLLEAMKGLPADVHLWVAGQGPQTSALRAATAHDRRIEWLGRISDSEKAERLKAADVFCAPSTEGESFGIVLLEAMAAGTPVVASDLDGYRNVAHDSSNAVLIAPGDTVALASALEKVLDDAEMADQLRKHGFARAERFAMTGLAERYVELYEQCLTRYPLVS